MFSLRELTALAIYSKIIQNLIKFELPEIQINAIITVTNALDKFIKENRSPNPSLGSVIDVSSQEMFLLYQRPNMPIRAFLRRQFILLQWSTNHL